MGVDVARIARPVVTMVAVLLVLACPTESRADPPSCPDAESTELYSGTFSAPWTSLDFPIDPQRPCETLMAQISATVPYQAGLMGEFLNASGTVVDAAPGSCYGSCAFGVPKPGYAPWRGTSGPYTRVTTVRVRVTFLIGPPPLQFTLTLTRTPRPGYNLGGATLARTPRIGPLPRTVSGNCHANAAETGQYYKVRLAGSGTLSVAGLAQGGLPYGGNLFADVYAAGGTFAQQILAAGVSPSGASFSSTTFANPSPEPAVFYLRVYCNYWGVWDFNDDRGGRGSDRHRLVAVFRCR